MERTEQRGELPVLPVGAATPVVQRQVTIQEAIPMLFDAMQQIHDRVILLEQNAHTHNAAPAASEIVSDENISS